MERNEMKNVRYGLTDFDTTFNIQTNKSIKKPTEFRIVYGLLENNLIPLVFKFMFNDESKQEAIIGNLSPTIVLESHNTFPSSRTLEMVEKVAQSVLFTEILAVVKSNYSNKFDESMDSPNSLPYWNFEKNTNLRAVENIFQNSISKDYSFMYFI